MAHSDEVTRREGLARRSTESSTPRRPSWVFHSPNSKAVPCATLKLSSSLRESGFSHCGLQSDSRSSSRRGSSCGKPSAPRPALPVTAHNLELLVKHATAADVRPGTPQPRTPTISESSYRLPSQKSRLSDTSSSSRENARRGEHDQTPASPPSTSLLSPRGSRIPSPALQQTPEQLQLAIQREAACLRELQHLAEVVCSPSAVDLTPLRQRFTTASPTTAVY